MAFKIGVSYAEHWNTNPKIFEKQLKAYQERLQEADMLNHLLGKYIAYASNNPKKYPKKPFLGYSFGEKKEKRVMSDEEMERIAKRNNIILGGKTK